jgi:hypothetical protein
MGGSSKTNTNQNSSTQFASQSLSNFLSQMSNAYSSTNAQRGTTTQSSGPTEAAKAMINQASQPISADQIAKYQNPYQEQVINATMAQLNNQYANQQNTLRGNAISQGALGGDRAKVAQAALMGQQGLNTASTLGGLQSQGYAQALSAAQAQQARELQAAGMMGTTSTGTSDVLGSSTGTSTGQQWGTNATNTSGTSNTQQYGQSETSNNPGIFGWMGLLADGGAVRGYDDGGAVMGVPEWAKIQPMQLGQAAPQQQQKKKGKGLMSNAQDMMKQYNQMSGAGAGDFAGASDAGTASTGAVGGEAGVTAADSAAVAADAAGAGAGAAEGVGAAGAGAAEGAGAAASGVGEGLGALFALFSDERMKENKHEVGRLFDGQKVYAFNYKGHPQTQLGLMAQEVERSHPEAVGESGGALTVRYDTATRDAAKRGHFADGGAPGYDYTQPQPTYNQGTYQLGQQARTGLGKLFDTQPQPMQQPIQKPSSLDTIANAMQGDGGNGVGAMLANGGWAHYDDGGDVTPGWAQAPAMNMSTPEAPAPHKSKSGAAMAKNMSMFMPSMRAFGGRNYDDGGTVPDDFYAQPVLPVAAPVEKPETYTPMFGRGTLESPIFGAPNTVIGDIVGAKAKAPPPQSAVPAEAFAAPQGGLTGLQPGVATRSPTPQLQPGLAYQPGRQGGLAPFRTAVEPTPPEVPVTPVKTFQVNPMAAPTPAAPPSMAEPGAEQIAPAPVHGGLAPVLKPQLVNHLRTFADTARQEGASDNAILGIGVNIRDESGGNPGLVGKGDQRGRFKGEANNAHGLFQFGGDNWTKYEDWRNENYPDSKWEDPSLQTKFLVQQLKTEQPETWRRMNEAKTPGEAAQIFLHEYEKPAARYASARHEQYGRGVGTMEDLTADVPTVTRSRDAIGRETRTDTAPPAAGAAARPEPTRTGALASLFGGNQGQPAGAAPGAKTPPPLFDPRGGSIGALLRGEGSPVAAPGEQRGGVLQRLFGLNINPLQLTDNERAALIAGGFGGAQGAQIGAGVYQGLRGQDIQAQTHGAELALKAQQLAQGLAEPKVMGENYDQSTGQWHKQYGAFNPSTNSYIPVAGPAGAVVPASGAPAGMDAIPMDVVGKDFVEQAKKAGYNSNVLASAQEVADYKADPSRLAGMKGEQRQIINRLAHRINPDYDMTKYTAISAAEKNLTSGKTATALSSIGRLFDETEQAYSLVDQMGGSRYETLNKAYGSAYPSGSEYGVARSKLGISLNNVGSSASSVAKGGGAGAEGDAKRRSESLNVNQSPAALRGSLLVEAETGLKIGQSNLNAYNAAHGYTPDNPKYKSVMDQLSPAQQKKAIKMLGAEKIADITGKPVEGAEAETAAGEPTHKVANDDEYNQLPSGAKFVGPDGKVRRKS